MASITVTLAPTISSGTATVYPQSNWPYGTPIAGAPVGSSVTTGSVGADGSVTFSGLTAGTSYVAYQASPDRYVQFRVNTTSSTLSSSLVTAKGDLLAATGSGVVVRKGVGSDGQVLTADAASTEGVKWATASGGGAASGRAKGAGVTYLSAPGLVVTGTQTSTQSANRAVYEYMRVAAPITIDQLVCECTTAQTGGKLRMAIYSASSDLQPTTLVADSGELDVSTTGMKAGTITPTVLSPGLYLKWLNVSAAGIVTRVLQYQVNAFGFITTAVTQIGILYTAQTYGAPPATGLAWDTIATGNPLSSVLVRESVA